MTISSPVNPFQVCGDGGAVTVGVAVGPVSPLVGAGGCGDGEEHAVPSPVRQAAATTANATRVLVSMAASL